MLISYVFTPFHLRRVWVPLLWLGYCLCCAPLRAEETQPAAETTAEETSGCHLALKSNLLYDLALIPNMGCEVALGRHCSLGATGHYTRLHDGDRHRWWFTYGADMTVRYHWGRAAQEAPLSGHHVGLYGQLLAYDIELGGRGYQGRRWSYGGGVEYGYSWALSRRWRLEAAAGVGYLTGRYREYVPEDYCRVWVATKNRQWFGPTRAEATLVWLLF